MAQTAPADRLPVGIEATRWVKSIRERSRSVSARDHDRTEEKLAAAVAAVDMVPRIHEPSLARRLALEFGMPADQLLGQRNQLGVMWSDLVIAHTLTANLEAGPGATDLLRLHDFGVGWSRIASALGFDLGHLVSAARAEVRVATGQVKPDGKVASIRSDLGPVPTAGRLGAEGRGATDSGRPGTEAGTRGGS